METTNSLEELQKAIDGFLDIQKVGVAGRSGRPKSTSCQSAADHKHPTSQWTEVCHDITRGHRNEEEQKWHLRECASSYLNRAPVLQAGGVYENVKQQLADAGYDSDEKIKALSEEYSNELQGQLQQPKEGQAPQQETQPDASGGTQEGQKQGEQPKEEGQAPPKPAAGGEQQPAQGGEQPQGEGQQVPQEGQQPPAEGQPQPGAGGEVPPPEPNIPPALKDAFDKAEQEASETIDKTKLAKEFEARPLTDIEHEIMVNYYYSVLRCRLEKTLLVNEEAQEDYYKDAKKYVASQVNNLVKDNLIAPEKEFGVRDLVTGKTVNVFHTGLYEMDEDAWKKYGIEKDLLPKLFGDLGMPWWEELAVDLIYSYIETQQGDKIDYTIFSKIDADLRFCLVEDNKTGLRSIGITEKNINGHDVPKEFLFSGLHGYDADTILQFIFRFGITTHKELLQLFEETIGDLRQSSSGELPKILKEAKYYSS